jgi:acetyl-CoA/propionyl-CoA carboxylase biotin carboxyl carrier protein
VIVGTPDSAKVAIEDGESRTLAARLDGPHMSVTIDGLRANYVVAERDNHIWLGGSTGTAMVRQIEEVNVRVGDVHAGQTDITSPMPGSVIAVNIENGATVTAGTAIVVVEAMKMEHALRAPVDGKVELLVAPADQVKVDQVLARIVPTGESTNSTNESDEQRDEDQ